MRRTVGLVGLTAVILAACAPSFMVGPDRRRITWAPGSFDSIGEQIYFTGVNADGDHIRYSGGPATGMMMEGYLSCASCHGPDAEGGRHVMHMEVMEAPDIRWSALAGEGHDQEGHQGEGEHDDEYTLMEFRQAVVEGQHPDGDPLSREMPRWQMSEESLGALRDYLASLD